MEPSFKINDTEYKPLSQCDRSETTTILDQLLEKQSMAVNLPNDSVYMQLQAFIDQVEQRLHFFDIGYLEDKSARKRTRKRISLIDDD